MRRTPFGKISPAFLMCVVALSTANAEETEHLLRYKFEPGQVIRYRASIYDDYDVSIGGADDQPHSHADSIKQYEVIRVADDGTATIELMYEWARMDIAQNGGAATWDSRTGDDPGVLFEGMSKIVGKRHLRLQVTPNGEISHVQPLLNEKQSAEDVTADFLIPLPHEPIKVGAIWKREDSVPLKVPGSPQLRQDFRIQRRYFLRSVDKGVATIDLKTKVLTPVNDPQFELQLHRRQPTGEIRIDLNRGILLSRTLTQKAQVVNFSGPSRLDFQQSQKDQFIEPQVAVESNNSSTR